MPAHPFDLDAVLRAADLRALGVSPQQVRTARRRGHLSRPWRGVDVTAAAARDPVIRARMIAALAPAGVLSGPTAARVLGLPTPDTWHDEVTLPPGTPHIRARVGLVVVRRPVPDDKRAIRRGLAITTAARTVADLLCARTGAEALWLTEQALARGLDRADVAAAIEPRQRGAVTARRHLAVADPRGESPLESAVALVLAGSSLPAPERQLVVRAGELVCRLDFAWPQQRVVLEADGVGWHSAPAAVLHDRVRQNALTVRGWRFVRATWWDVRDRPSQLVGDVAGALALAGGTLRGRGRPDQAG